jgi:hypothetical protein
MKNAKYITMKVKVPQKVDIRTNGCSEPRAAIMMRVGNSLDILPPEVACDSVAFGDGFAKVKFTWWSEGREFDRNVVEIIVSSLRFSRLKVISVTNNGK